MAEIYAELHNNGTEITIQQGYKAAYGDTDC